MKKWQIDKAVRISDRPTFMTTSLYNLRLRLSINYTITNRGWWRDGGLILKWFTPCLNCFRPFPNRYSSYPIQMRRLLSSVTKDKKWVKKIVRKFSFPCPGLGHFGLRCILDDFLLRRNIKCSPTVHPGDLSSADLPINCHRMIYGRSFYTFCAKEGKGNILTLWCFYVS